MENIAYIRPPLYTFNTNLDGFAIDRSLKNDLLLDLTRSFFKLHDNLLFDGSASLEIN
jgi:hypothetical protein